MNILAIDPGTTESGWVSYAEGRVFDSGVAPNDDVLRWVSAAVRDDAWTDAPILAIEMIASYGMPVGKEVFDTCVWVGRFVQAWHSPEEVRLVYRKDVKIALCGTTKAKDGNIRQALIDKLGPQGTKAKPGPTYGVRSHAWAALAVAVTIDAASTPLFAPEPPKDCDAVNEAWSEAEMNDHRPVPF